MIFVFINLLIDDCWVSAAWWIIQTAEVFIKINFKGCICTGICGDFGRRWYQTIEMFWTINVVSRWLWRYSWASGSLLQLATVEIDLNTNKQQVKVFRLRPRTPIGTFFGVFNVVGPCDAIVCLREISFEGFLNKYFSSPISRSMITLGFSETPNVIARFLNERVAVNEANTIFKLNEVKINA